MAKGTTLRNVRIAEELWGAAQQRANCESTTVSEVIRRLLTEWVDSPA